MGKKQERGVKVGWYRYEYIIWQMWCTGLSFFLGNDRFKENTLFLSLHCHSISRGVVMSKFKRGWDVKFHHISNQESIMSLR